jgi:drug/metabolite transporter (DMT)-like permease
MVFSMNSAKTSYPPSVWVALASVYVIWGSTYLAIRFAVDSIPPYFMAGTRFLISGLLLYGCVRFFGAPRPSWIHWRSTALIGFMLITLANGAVSWAEKKVPSGIACLLVATVPLWMTLLNWLWKKNGRPGALLSAGLALGFLGMIWLAVFSGGFTFTVPVPGLRWSVAGLVGSTMVWAIGSLYARSAALPASGLLSAAMEMIWGGLFQLALSGLLGEWSQVDFHRFTPASEWAWLYLTLIGSLVGFTSYIWVLQKSTPALASTYAFVNPVIAVFLGWLFAGEAVTLPVFAAAGLIVAGVVLITLAPRGKEKT